jgi:ketosteroid isomerase-like protein
VADRGEVAAALEQWMANVERRDWRAVFAQMTDDGVFSSPVPERSLVERGAIEAWVDTWADDPSEIDVEWTVVDGDQAAVSWRQRLPSELPPDQQPSFPGVMTLVYGGGGRFSSLENIFDTRQAETMSVDRTIAATADVADRPPRSEVEHAFRTFRHAFEAVGASAVAACMTVDCEFTNSAMTDVVRGREAVRALIETWPAIDNALQWCVVDGARVVAVWRERPAAATPETPVLRGVQVLVYAHDGLFRSYENVFDTRAMELTYGLAPTE